MKLLIIGQETTSVSGPTKVVDNENSIYITRQGKALPHSDDETKKLKDMFARFCCLNGHIKALFRSGLEWRKNGFLHRKQQQ